MTQTAGQHPLKNLLNELDEHEKIFQRKNPDQRDIRMDSNRIPRIVMKT